MMNRLTQVQNVRWILASLAVVLLGIFAHTALSEDKQEVRVIGVTRETYLPEKVSTLPYEVSGTVKAKQDIVVRAKTAGTVGRILAREGAPVAEGELMLALEVPLVGEKIALQGAQNEYARLSHEGSVIGVEAGELRAQVQSKSAETVLGITGTSSASEEVHATELLRVQLHGSLLSLVTALDFIDANRIYFSGESAEKFRETLGTLYGRTPSYLIGGVRYAIDSEEDILGLLETAREGEELLELARIAGRELNTVQVIFKNAEYDFLDEGRLNPSDALYSAYLEHRATLISGTGDLESAVANLDGVLHGNTLSVHGAETDVLIGTIDYSSATRTTENTRALLGQNVAVGEAGLSLLYGEEALGMLRAPFAGVVAEVFVEEGEYVTPGTPLVRLSGTGAQELLVSLPAVMLEHVREGLAFSVSGSTEGFISRFVPVVTDGSVSVFIELSGTPRTVGSTLRGAVQVESEESDLVRIPRKFLYFGNDGPYVRTEGGRNIPVTIVHDGGGELYVQGAEPIEEKLIPAVGLRF
jgi:multidrug efflux pump subunit AcrA (membrane-fusion protein)